MWFLALFAVVSSGVLLGLSAFPGVLEQIPRTVALVGGGGAALVAAVLALRHLVRSNRRRWAVVALGAAVLTPTLLLTHVPRRILFGHYRPEFEALLPNAPPAGDRTVIALNADLDLYWIDQWGTDARGGTYFRTLTGTGPNDRRSFGFAHRPNPHGSPFGDAGYELHHLTGDWYSFAAADR
jgi:hypothetical protein